MDDLCRWICCAGADEKVWTPTGAWRARPARSGGSTARSSFHECVADDVKPANGRRFHVASSSSRTRTVVFSWITFKSRAHRDRVNAKVMKDKRLGAMMDGKRMPFDGKRMIYGGFKVLVEA